MSKKSKLNRTSKYWREQNYEKVYNELNRLNKYRRIDESFSTFKDIKIELNKYGANDMLNIDRPLDEGTIREIADKFSRMDDQLLHNLNAKQAISYKQAALLVDSANGLGYNVTIQDILNGSLNYYILRNEIRRLTSWSDSEIDLYIFGS